MLLVSATMKNPPSGTKGLRPAVVRASIRRELRGKGGRGRKEKRSWNERSDVRSVPSSLPLSLPSYRLREYSSFSHA